MLRSHSRASRISLIFWRRNEPLVWSTETNGSEAEEREMEKSQKKPEEASKGNGGVRREAEVQLSPSGNLLIDHGRGVKRARRREQKRWPHATV